MNKTINSQQNARRTKGAVKAKWIIYTEFLYVLFPMIVLMGVFAYQNKFMSVFYAPEWSFATALLTGQSINKLISGISNEPIKNSQGLILIVTFLILFLLAPSLIVLSMILLSPTPDNKLAVTQIILFAVSSVAFRIFGTAGQRLSDE